MDDNLNALINKCLTDAFHHIDEGSAPALNQAVQEINQALCSLFQAHLSDKMLSPPTDHDKLVTKMRTKGEPRLDDELAEYLYDAHEKLRVQAYHKSTFPEYFETLRYFCVAEAVCSDYGVQLPYSEFESFEDISFSRLSRLLPIDNSAFAYIDYKFVGVRFKIISIAKLNGVRFYYPSISRSKSFVFSSVGAACV